MAYPDDYEWIYPGFYSITVPYGKENNFLFTAHISLITIIMCEFITSSRYILAVISGCALIL